MNMFVTLFLENKSNLCAKKFRILTLEGKISYFTLFFSLFEKVTPIPFRYFGSDSSSGHLWKSKSDWWTLHWCSGESMGGNVPLRLLGWFITQCELCPKTWATLLLFVTLTGVTASAWQTTTTSPLILCNISPLASWDSSVSGLGGIIFWSFQTCNRPVAEILYSSAFSRHRCLKQVMHVTVYVQVSDLPPEPGFTRIPCDHTLLTSLRFRSSATGWYLPGHSI